MTNSPEGGMEKSGESTGQNTWQESMADAPSFDASRAEELKSQYEESHPQAVKDVEKAREMAMAAYEDASTAAEIRQFTKKVEEDPNSAVAIKLNEDAAKFDERADAAAEKAGREYDGYDPDSKEARKDMVLDKFNRAVDLMPTGKYEQWIKKSEEASRSIEGAQDLEITLSAMEQLNAKKSPEEVNEYLKSQNLSDEKMAKIRDTILNFSDQGPDFLLQTDKYTFSQKMDIRKIRKNNEYLRYIDATEASHHKDDAEWYRNSIKNS